MARVQSKAKLMMMQAAEIKMAVLNSCERCDSSRREVMATSPATISTTVNSNGCWSMLAQISTIVIWVMKAVRESMKMRIKMGSTQ